MRKIVSRFNTAKRWQRITLLSLAAAIGLASINTQANAAPGSPRQVQRPQQKVDLQRLTWQQRQDLLLIMPNSSADKDELSDALRDNKGEVIGQLGTGPLTVLVVRVPHGQTTTIARKLEKDRKNFNAIEPNKIEGSCALTIKDPGISSAAAWHFERMHLREAWDLLSKNKNPRMQGMIVMDTGCSMQSDVNRESQGCNVTGETKNMAKALRMKMFLNDDVDDHKNFIISLGNKARTLTYDFTDTNGHGTWVSSSAGSAIDEKGSIGVNPGIHISPIKIANGPYGEKCYTDDLTVVSAMMCAFDVANAPVNNIKIINISYANMFDDDKHVLHELFKHWYYKMNGLIFVSAGNDGVYHKNKDLPYLNVVSAMGHRKGMRLANVPDAKEPWASDYGPCVDFTAPGEDVVVTDIDGMSGAVDGTSFSSPIVAAVASLVWSINPDLKNTQIEDILRRSATNTTAGRNQQFGWGMPDAEKAIKLAIGRK